MPVWERSLNQKYIVIPKIIDTISVVYYSSRNYFLILVFLFFFDKSHSSFSNRPERNATNFLQHSFIKQDKKYIH